MKRRTLGQGPWPPSSLRSSNAQICPCPPGKTLGHLGKCQYRTWHYCSNPKFFSAPPICEVRFEGHQSPGSSHGFWETFFFLDKHEYNGMECWTCWSDVQLCTARGVMVSFSVSSGCAAGGGPRSSHLASPPRWLWQTGRYRQNMAELTENLTRDPDKPKPKHGGATKWYNNTHLNGWWTKASNGCKLIKLSVTTKTRYSDMQPSRPQNGAMSASLYKASSKPERCSATGSQGEQTLVANKSSKSKLAKVKRTRTSRWSDMQQWRPQKWSHECISLQKPIQSLRSAVRPVHSASKL